MGHLGKFFTITLAMIIFLAGSTDKTLAQTKSATWTTLTLMNGWKRVDRAPAAMLDADNIVHFRGGIKKPDNVDAVITQLPVSMRPAKDILLPAAASQGTFIAVLVSPTGFVNVVGNDITKALPFTSLDGLNFSK